MSTYTTPAIPLARRKVPVSAETLSALARQPEPEVREFREAQARANARWESSREIARMMRQPSPTSY